MIEVHFKAITPLISRVPTFIAVPFFSFETDERLSCFLNLREERKHIHLQCTECVEVDPK